VSLRPSTGLRGGSAGLNSSRAGKDAGDQTGATRPDFIPGMDGSFYWNTTVPVGSKPILVYLYNGHEIEDDNASYCRKVERGSFKDKRVAAIARRFTCEKVCFGCHELGLTPPHREAVSRYLRSLGERPELRAHVALLDATGRVIHEFKRPPASGALLQGMVLADKENRRRLEEAAVDSATR